MLRQGPLGSSQPPRRSTEPNQPSDYMSAGSATNAETSYHSIGDSSLDPDFSQDASEEEETFVHEDHNLESIPQDVYETIISRQGLQKLSLKGNRLTAIGEGIGKLNNLYYLNLSHNRFKEVPACIGDLQSLEILDMSNNALSALPHFLTRLPQLIGLSLVANNLEVFPIIIADLPKLVILEIEDNPIRVPASLPSVSDAKDEESWLQMVREYIKLHRAEIENALRPLPPPATAHRQHSSISAPVAPPLTPVTPGSSVSVASAPLGTAQVAPQLHPSSSDSQGQQRPLPERLRSASESNVSLRAAKRMGFVMSRNASEQSYVSSLHARGLSHDASMIEQNTHTPTPSNGRQAPYSSESYIGSSPSLSQSSSNSSKSYAHAPEDVHNHGRSLSSFAAVSEYSELPPKSPVARSPFGSPWGSPRISVAEGEPSVAISGRLSTLAEEYDGDSDAGDTEADSSYIQMSREPSALSTNDNEPSLPLYRRPSVTMPTLPETVKEEYEDIESSNETASSSSPSVVFKDFYAEPPRSTTTNPTYTTTPNSTTASSTNGHHQSYSSVSTAHRHNSSTPSLATPTSATSSAIENIAFALEQVSSRLRSIASTLPPVINSSLRETQELAASKQWGRALTAFTQLLEKLTVPVTFHLVNSRLSRRQQRQFAMTIALTFPELEAAWRHLQYTKIMPVTIDGTHQHQWEQDEQLHNQLDHAVKGAQSVLSLLNSVIARSAVAAADGPEPTSEMAGRVRDLSAVCIRCSGATRNVRNLLDRQATAHARTLQLSERRRFWEEVNSFLKAVISTLAAVKAALPDMPLLTEGHVGTEVAKLSRVAKEIPPLLEQSSYRVLLDSSGAQTENFELPYSVFATKLAPNATTPSVSSPTTSLQQSSQNLGGTHVPPPLNMQQIQQQFAQTAGASQVNLPPPTPLTASLGAAAQALISPNERVERSDGYIQFGLHNVSDYQ